MYILTNSRGDFLGKKGGYQLCPRKEKDVLHSHLLPYLVVALLDIRGGADLLIGGGTVGRVVMTHYTMVSLPLLQSGAHRSHHPQELLRLQGGLAASLDPAEVEDDDDERGVVFSHCSALSKVLSDHQDSWLQTDSSLPTPIL